MANNPFAELEETAPDAPAVAAEPSALIEVPSGSVFVYDLETVPDETRFPRPVRRERVAKPDHDCDLKALQASAVPAIKRLIPLLSLSQLSALAELERAAKKARSGVTEAIDQQIESENADPFESEFAEWKKLSFNPFGLRIVALGVKSEKHRVTMLAKTPDEERELLRILWKHIDKFRVRCGYNITGFDDLVLIVRSRLLGVESPRPISRKKFGDRESIDLMTALFPSGQAMKLKELCRMLGIVPPAGYEMSGDKVLDLVDAGDWDGVHKYVSSDADIEWELYAGFRDLLVF